MQLANSLLSPSKKDGVMEGRGFFKLKKKKRPRNEPRGHNLPRYVFFLANKKEKNKDINLWMDGWYIRQRMREETR